MTAAMFTAATDAVLVDLIDAAQKRLAVLAPALPRAVGEAIARRLGDLDRIAVAVVLDSDAEVYRLGFGDVEALEAVRTASAANHFDLRQQPGVRICVVVSDDTVLVFSPVSRNIEAGSTSTERPNAFTLSGAIADRFTEALGLTSAERDTREVGTEALQPAAVAAMVQNLQANPPKPFDLTRRLNVFASRVQYVELSVSRIRMTARKVRLPPELVDVADDGLRKQISSTIESPLAGVGRLSVTVGEGDTRETIEVDDDWLARERKRIEDEYTYQIDRYGRLVFREERADFDSAVARLEAIARAYVEAIRAKVSETRVRFEESIAREFLPRWIRSPPAQYRKWGTPTAGEMESDLRHIATRLFDDAVAIDPPEARIVYKNVAPENLDAPDFMDRLRSVMLKRKVPQSQIDRLFESGEAAPVDGSFAHMLR